MVVSIRVKANSRKNNIGFSNGMLTVSINAPPHDGKANEALIRFLSEILDVPKSAISIRSGHTTPFKRLEVPDECKDRLERLKKSGN